MADIGALSVSINADSSGLNRGIRDARGNLQQFGRQARQTINRIGQIGVAATAAGAAIFAGMVRNTAQAIDEQAKLARSIDASIDGLRGYQEAAADAGISNQAAAQSAQILNQRLGEARRGTGAAAEQLRRLGLDANELARMDVDERMAALADRMRALGFDSAQTGDALRQLGIRNREMVTLMQEGGDAIRNARQEIDDFGLSISEVDARQVEIANDAMRRVGRTLEVIRTQITVALAPIITELAGRLNDAAYEAGGFRQAAQDAAETGLRGFGHLADVVEGVRRTFMLLGQAIATAMLGAQALVWETAEAIINGPGRAINQLTRLINNLPFVDVQQLGMSNLGKEVNQKMRLAQRATREGVAAMQGTLMRPMPSSSIEEMIDSIRERARGMAEEAVGARRELLDLSEIGSGMEEENAAASEERDEEELDRRREMMERRLEILREGLMDEKEMEEHRHEEKLEELREFLEQELLTEKEFDELKEDVEQAHMDKMRDIRRRGLSDMDKLTEQSWRKQANAVASRMAEMTAIVGRESRAMFEINKIAAIANALLSAREAITGAYAFGARIGGPPLGAAMAGVAAASTAAQINQIRGQSFGGGGGSSPSVQSSSAGTPVTETGGGGSGGGGSISRSITIRGEGVSQEWIRESLVPALNEAAGDGVRFGG